MTSNTDLQLIQYTTIHRTYTRTLSLSLALSLTVAKKTILLNWKSKNSININHWINLLLEHIPMEKNTIYNNNSFHRKKVHISLLDGPVPHTYLKHLKTHDNLTRTRTHTHSYLFIYLCVPFYIYVPCALPFFSLINLLLYIYYILSLFSLS